MYYFFIYMQTFSLSVGAIDYWNVSLSHIIQKIFFGQRYTLKAHVRDKPLYCTLTSGLCWSPWLIPHNVLLNAQTAGSADKRTRLGPTTEFLWSHRPIQYGRPNYITHEPGFEPGSCVQRLFDTLANHRTHNTRPHCHFDWHMGIGCATLGMDQWETIFFLRRG